MFKELNDVESKKFEDMAKKMRKEKLNKDNEIVKLIKSWKIWKGTKFEFMITKLKSNGKSNGNILIITSCFF